MICIYIYDMYIYIYIYDKCIYIYVYIYMICVYIYAYMIYVYYNIIKYKYNTYMGCNIKSLHVPALPRPLRLGSLSAPHSQALSRAQSAPRCSSEATVDRR